MLSVPLTYTTLNQMLSVTGRATPAEDFAPGTPGFSIAESNFTSGGMIMGAWRFLGREIMFGPDMQICPDSEVPPQCELIDPVLLRSPFDYTRKTIVRLTSLSLAAARSGRWRGFKGTYSVPFMSRGARVLARMERLFRSGTSTYLACKVVPMSCSVQLVPKKKLAKLFAQIFSRRLPKGLEMISRRSKREIAGFRRLMKRLPNTYVKCD
jgi:hypothetical protein